MADAEMPSYTTPPVTEVVTSVQFARLPWLTPAHTGLYWALIRDDYPNCDEQLPIEHKEEPEQLLGPQRIKLEFPPKPPLSRQWFVSESGNDLIQLQPDRFCVNWRKMNDQDEYPRFEYVKTMFRDRWMQFREFVQTTSGSAPEVDQLEMTYVNHVFKDEGWSAPSEIGRVFPAISFHEKPNKYLPQPATLGARIVFDMGWPTGRLHVSCHHALTKQPERELFKIDMVARGKPESGEIDDLVAWFTQAREWIVRGFADLMDDEMQRTHWGREK